MSLTVPLYAFRLSECLRTAAQRSESALCTSAALLHTHIPPIWRNNEHLVKNPLQDAQALECKN